ncbi:MAG: PDZ domain-containing protein [Polyangiaceae bacterium]
MSFGAVVVVSGVARAAAPLPVPTRTPAPVPAPTVAPVPVPVPANAAAPSPPPVPNAADTTGLTGFAPTAAQEAARRGVVSIERDGKTLSAGIVLAGDGRVVTSWTGLAGATLVDVRYVDGSVVHARVGHKDPTWDLALLVPAAARWTEGLKASEAPAKDTELRTIVAARFAKTGIHVTSLRGIVEGRATVVAKDAKEPEPLPGLLDFEAKGVAVPLGSPLVDPSGDVVGVVVRACKASPATTCVGTTVGAPISALRRFLVTTPANAVPPSPFLGIVGAPDMAGSSKGVRVMAVAPKSPAEKGGLHGGDDRARADLIVAVDGEPVDNPESLAKAIAKHAVGEKAKLLVFSADRFREVSVTLVAAP